MLAHPLPRLSVAAGTPPAAVQIGNVVTHGMLWNADHQYGNFDIILVHFPRRFKLDGTLDAPCAVLYLVPMIIAC